MLKGKVRSLISSVLAFVMLLTATPSFAFEADLQRDGEYELYRLAAAGGDGLVEAHPNGLFEFVETSYSLDADSRQESDIVVLRRGGTEGEAEVTLAFLDISARYGLDYKIKIDGKYVDIEENSQSLMDAFIDQSEMSLGGDADTLSIALLDQPREMTEQEMEEYGLNTSDPSQEELPDELAVAAGSEQGDIPAGQPQEMMGSGNGEMEETVSVLESGLEPDPEPAPDPESASVSAPEPASAPESGLSAPDFFEDKLPVVDEAEQNSLNTDLPGDAAENEKDEIGEIDETEGLEQLPPDPSEEDLPVAVEPEPVPEQSKSLRMLRNEELGNISDRPGTSPELFVADQKDKEKAEDYFRRNAYLKVTLNFGDGEFEKRLSIELTPSSEYYTDKQVLFMLIDPQNAETGDNSQGVLNIYTNRTPETAVISNAAYIDNNGGFCELVLTKTGALGAYTVVVVSTEDGDALEGRDYTAYNANVVFVPGATERIVRIPVSENAGAGEFTVRLSAQGSAKIETPVVTASTAEPLQALMYSETVNGSKTDALNYLDFSRTGWESNGSPYIDYGNSGGSWPVWRIRGYYGSIRSNYLDFYGYAGMEAGWSNSLSYVANQVEYNKISLFNAPNGGDSVDLYKSKDKSKGWTQSQYSFSDDQIKNYNYIDFAAKYDGTKNKTMNMQIDWVRLYKQPYRFFVDINIGAKQNQFGDWNDYYHTQYLWKGPTVTGRAEKGEKESGNLYINNGNSATASSSSLLFKDEQLIFNVVPNPGMYLAGYKIAASGNNLAAYKALNTSSSYITLDGSFLKDFFDYKNRKTNTEYGLSSIIKDIHEYTVRPVFKRLDASAVVRWDPAKGGVSNVGGGVAPYSNNATFTVGMFDDIEIQVTSLPGYVPSGISLNGKFIEAGSNPYYYRVTIQRDSDIELLF